MDNTIINVLSALNRSSFRAKFTLRGKELVYLHEKGRETIKQHAYDFINCRIAPAAPKNDGKQTPMKGHPVFIAQHATATCCRNCILKWHKIEKGKALNEKEVDYLVDVIVAWIETQVDRG